MYLRFILYWCSSLPLVPCADAFSCARAAQTSWAGYINTTWTFRVSGWLQQTLSSALVTNFRCYLESLSVWRMYFIPERGSSQTCFWPVLHVCDSLKVLVRWAPKLKTLSPEWAVFILPESVPYRKHSVLASGAGYFLCAAVPLGIVPKLRMTSFCVSEVKADTSTDAWLSLHPSPRTLPWCEMQLSFIQLNLRWQQ